MFGLSLETICMIGSFLVLTIAQTILVLKGDTRAALRLEKKKGEQLNKLTAKREKHLRQAESENAKIKELKEILKNENSSNEL